MASVEKVMKIIWELEFSNCVDRALEQNPGEAGLTYKGIYEVAHPEWSGWGLVKDVLAECGGDKKAASRKLEEYKDLQNAVTLQYKEVFWDKMRLDEVENQHTANELMIFGINAGAGKAVKLAQQVVGVEVDGLIGPATIAALNTFDAAVFDKAFDAAEEAYYQHLVDNNPKFRVFAAGWRARAEFV